MYTNKPYVYKGVHRETGEFYIGYREANELPAQQDFGAEYFTSSEEVDALGFENFEWCIVAEFYDEDRKKAGDDAYDHENRLIGEDFHNPLCLNGQYTKDGQVRFKRSGPLKDSTKQKLSDIKTGTKLSEDTKYKIGMKHKGMKRSDEARANIGEGLIGHVVSESTKRKLSEYRTGTKQTEETKTKIQKSTKSALQAKMGKRFRLISPDGIVYEGLGLCEFIRQHPELKLTSTSSLCRGILKEYKGWTGKYIEGEE